MSTRRVGFVLALLLVPAGARGGDHVFDVYAAGSYLAGSGSTIRLGGLHASVAVTAGHTHRNLSFVGDLSAHFIGHEKEGPLEAGLKQYTFMAGPRLTFRGGHILMPFAQATPLGLVRRTGGFRDATAFATAAALGLDVAPGDVGTWGFRAQVEVIAAKDLRRSFRCSVGLVYRAHDAGEQAAARKKRPL